MSVCQNCNANVPEGTNFCPKCGTKLGGVAEPIPVNRAGKLHCPQCKSHNISPVTESSVNGGVTTHHGRMSTTSVSNTHRNYWMCADCGTKFRNIQNLEEEIAKTKSTPTVFRVIAIIALIISVYLIASALSSPLGIFAAYPAFIAVVCTIVFFIGSFVYSNKVKKMRAELEYLKANCFN